MTANREQLVDAAAAGWGQALAMLRLISGWNQGRLGRALGVANSTVSAYERGIRPVSMPLLRHAVAALGFPPHLRDRARTLARWATAARRLARDPDARIAAGAEKRALAAALATDDMVRQALGAVLQPGDGPIAPAAVLHSADGPAGETACGDPAGSPAGSGTPTCPPSEAPASPAERRGREPDRALAMALRILRQVICDVDRPALSLAAGLSAEAIKAYELAQDSPPAGKLERLLAAMDLSGEVLERMVAFVEEACAARHGPGRGLPSLDVQIASLAAAESRRAEEIHGAFQGRLAVAVMVLAARQRAAALWQRLAPLPHAARRALIEGVEELQDPALCELLCAASIRAAGDSPREALRLAVLAVLASRRIPPARGGGPRLQGYCRAHVANALRVAGRLARADRQLAQAATLWRAGASNDPGLLDEARMLSLEASLRSYQRRFPEALTLLDHALAIDRWGNTVSLLIGKANALTWQGEFETAIAVLGQAAPLIDPERETLSLFAVQLNVGLNLCELGRFAAARMALPEVRALAQRLGNRLDNLRVDLLEAKTAGGLRQYESAILRFSEVIAGFRRHNIAYDAALVVLDLAELYAQLGRTAAIKELARKAAPLFRAQGVHREARRALELFRHTTEQERATVPMIRSVGAYLHQARRDRSLRFREAA